MQTERSEYVACLNGLKGIGAFIIAFIWHYQQFDPPYGNPLSSIFGLSYIYGWSMVDLFFMLSGLGMMIGYGRKVFDKEVSFKTFFIKRINRLYPLFLLSTLIVFVLELLFKIRTGKTFMYPNYDIYHLVLNLLVLQNGLLGTEFSFNGPSWCLSIFLVLYSMFYFIIYRVKEFEHIPYVFCFTAILGASLIASELSYPVFNGQVARGIASFSIGVLVYWVYSNRDKFNSVKLGYCCVAFLVASYLLLRFRSVDFAGNFKLAMTLGFGPMIIIAILFVSWINMFMRNPIFMFLGNISWEMYLFHFPVQCMIKNIETYFNLELNYSGILIWGVYTVSTIVIAIIYHYFIKNRLENYICAFFKLKN